MSETIHLKFENRDPDLSRIREVARGCREGRLVAFPTETVYGIGGPMSVRGVASRLVELKGRAPDKPFALHIGDWDMIGLLGITMPPPVRYLAQKFWPGPLTLVVKNSQGEKVGLRFPRNRITAALISTVGEPFIATSANPSGEPSAKTPQEVLRHFDGKVHYLIDTGACEIGEDSTVVDVSENALPAILRRGAMAAEIEASLEKIRQGKYPRKKILIVCTGNSCRSPMAEGWLKKQLAHQGLGDEITVESCGVGARSGMPATAEAVMVAKNRDIDIHKHRSRACTRDMVVNSDLILAMGHDHYTFLSGLVPAARHKIKVLDIPDPIGMGMLLYEEVLNNMEIKMKSLWNEITA